MNTHGGAPEALNDGDRQSLNVLYQVTTADIVYFKQQQWMVMNYALGLDAALAVIAHQFVKAQLPVWVALVLAFLTCAVPIVAFLMLKRLRNSIAARRTRLEQTRAMLGPQFNKAWSVRKEPDDFYAIFVGVLATSWVVTLWLILTRT